LDPQTLAELRRHRTRAVAAAAPDTVTSAGVVYESPTFAVVEELEAVIA
jgi:hypothetical protein